MTTKKIISILFWPLMIGFVLLQIHLFLPQQTVLANYFAITLIFLWAILRFGLSILNKIESVIGVVKENFAKEPMLVSIGIVVFILKVVELQVSIYIELLGKEVNLSWLFWFSNVLPLVMSYSFIFFDKSYATFGLLASILYESFWSIDFLGRIFFDYPPFGGVADYMFKTYPFHFFVNLNHLFFIPLFLYAVIKIGVAKDAWITGIKFGSSLLAVTLIFTNRDDNINCLYQSCLKHIPFTDSPFVNLLIIGVLSQILVMAPLNWIFYKSYNKFRKLLSGRR